MTEQVNTELLKRIADIASKALNDKETQQMLLLEGFTAAKSITAGFMLSRVVKGQDNRIQSHIADIASNALNDCDTQERLSKTHGVDAFETAVAAITLMRIGDNAYSCVPKDLNEYKQMINALRENDFDNTVYRKVAG